MHLQGLKIPAAGGCRASTMPWQRAIEATRAQITQRRPARSLNEEEVTFAHVFVGTEVQRRYRSLPWFSTDGVRAVFVQGERMQMGEANECVRSPVGAGGGGEEGPRWRDVSLCKA